MGVGYNGKNFFVADINKMDDFGKRMGYQKGDELVSINGKNLPDASEVNEFLNNLRENLKVGDQLTIVVSRKDATGKANQVTLSQPVEVREEKKYNVLKEFPELTAAQKELRRAWLDTSSN